MKYLIDTGKHTIELSEREWFIMSHADRKIDALEQRMIDAGLLPPKIDQSNVEKPE